MSANGALEHLPPGCLLRLATLNDKPALTQLIAASARGLSRSHYTEAQVESALHATFGVDSVLIEDHTFLVIEHDGHLIACGGWSKRAKMFGSDAMRADSTNGASMWLDPTTEAARIRAFFVAPEWARRGLASALLDACERAAHEAGFRRTTLTATLSGVDFYRANSYVASEATTHTLEDGSAITFVPMTKVF